MIPQDGFAWNGQTFSSPVPIGKAMTGTNSFNPTLVPSKDSLLGFLAPLIFVFLSPLAKAYYRWVSKPQVVSHAIEARASRDPAH